MGKPVDHGRYSERGRRQSGTVRVARVASLLAFATCMLLGMAACGPERSGANDDALVAETLQIAADFVASGDVGRARVQLQNLDVANPTQWLLYLAESNVTSDADMAETASLVRLALGIGLQSSLLVDYATSNNLLTIEQPANQAEPPAAVANQPSTAPESAQNTETQPAANVAAAATPEPEETLPMAVILAPTETTPAQAANADDASEASNAADSSDQTEASESQDGSEQTEPAEQDASTADSVESTRVTSPQAQANSAMNVRGGPGTVYPVVGAMAAGDQAEIVAKNAQSDWWQVRLPDGQLGWVYGPLVQTNGDTASIVVAADIPQPPPTPVVEAPPPVEAPAEEPAQPAPPANDGPDFRVLEKRLWDVYENGGQLSGPTVICGEKRQLVVVVVDANGSRINGVAVQEQYGAKEIQVTGAQGKGDGVVEFILGRGQDVKVIRDADGREVSSELAAGMTTEPGNIPYDALIAGRYCTDDASCKKFVDAPGCWGHYSWTVTFQRNY